MLPVYRKYCLEAHQLLKQLARVGIIARLYFENYSVFVVEQVQ